ncbi:MAG: hypothetical protein LBL86_03800 [Coriobacteriales bacterium]|jgi:hypothetical protein|nr:hypothetical protein [Coriobacteriales bacterium]
MATSSFGQIVVLDDDMADRIIESNRTANTLSFGKGSDLFRPATKEETERIVVALGGKVETAK